MLKFTEVKIKQLDGVENIIINFFGINNLTPKIVSFLEKIINKYSNVKFIFMNTKLLSGNQLDIFKSDKVRILE